MGFFGGLSRAYGQFDKNVMGGLLPGGAQIAPQISGTVLAAQEAVPAIVQGALGLGDRTDRSINPRIQQGLIEAEANAKKRGAPSVAYEDYPNTGGGYAAKHTFGRVGFGEFKRDDKGNVTGIVQKYDTDKTPQEIQAEINAGGPAYKFAEKMLAQTQGRGMTTHDVDFTGNTPSPRMASQADITVNNAAPATPAMSYAVQAGDTLSAIAAANNTTVAEIAKKNNISNVDMIGIGQQLKF